MHVVGKMPHIGFAFGLLLLPLTLARGFGYGHGHSHSSMHGLYPPDHLQTGRPHHHLNHSGYGKSNKTTPSSTGLVTGISYPSPAVLATAAPLQPPVSSSEVAQAQSMFTSLANAGLGEDSPIGQAPVSGACGSQETVTETYNPTITVTVTAGSVDAVVGSPASPSSAPVDEAISVSSSVQGITVAASAPQVSAAQSSAQDQNSIASFSPSLRSAIAAASAPQVSDIQSSAQAQASVASSSAQAQASVASSSATPSGINKRGLIMQNDTGYTTGIQTLVETMNKGASKVSWVATWNTDELNGLTEDIEWIPQEWNTPTDGGEGVLTKFKKLVSSGTKALLNLGEVERRGTTVAEAVSFFKENMVPFASEGVTIGTPSILDETDTDWTWLKQFVAACTDCHFDFIAFHFMVGPTTTWSAETMFGMLQDKVSEAYTIGGGNVPVWIDNMAVPGTYAFQQSWLELVIPWLEANETVGRYAYVPQDPKTGTGFTDAATGALTPLGKWYLSYDG